jgi:hypothetical protein
MQASIHLRGDLCFQCDNCHHLRNMRRDVSFPTHLSDLAAQWLYLRHFLHHARSDAITPSKVKENRESESEAEARDEVVLLDPPTHTSNIVSQREERDGRFRRRQERKRHGSLSIKSSKDEKKLRTEL